MMEQYFSIKNNYPDTLLLYRMGDFYEIFYEDAKLVSKDLSIVLTSRGDGIPMCGIPYHAIDNYLPKLVKLGYKVAICEQLETPNEAKKRGYKSVVRREVVRVVTPGTIIDEYMLDNSSNSYLASIFFVKKRTKIKSHDNINENLDINSINKFSVDNNQSFNDSKTNISYNYFENPDNNNYDKIDINQIDIDKKIINYTNNSIKLDNTEKFENNIEDNNIINKNDNIDYSTKVAIAWADISTGEFIINTVELSHLHDELYRIMPQEIIVPDSLSSFLEDIIDLNSIKAITRRPNQMFCFDRVRTNITKHYGVSFTDGFGDFTENELSAAGALLEYISYTQKDLAPLLKKPSKLRSKDYLQIDKATRKGLELCYSINGEHKNTLFNVLNYANTAFSRRLLKNNIIFPLTNVEVINDRLDNVEWFIKNPSIRKDIMNIMSSLPDIERIVMRITTRRCNINDLLAIRNIFSKIFSICEILYGNDDLVNGLLCLKDQLGGAEQLRYELEQTFRENIIEQDGIQSFIRPDYNIQLDKLYEQKKQEIKKISELVEKYRIITKIDNLKIQYNNIIGYYIDISLKNAKNLNNPLFHHKQSLVNSARYKTEELQKIEQNLLFYTESIQNLEIEIMNKLIRMVVEYSDSLGIITFALAKIDIACTLAHVADIYGYTRPKVTNNTIFSIHGGRHPIVERNVDNFTSNDCNLNITHQNSNEINFDLLKNDKYENKVILLTGPNMAGKSTFLRQNALIVIMAQMGSYVPATNAQIGIVDAIFSRIGSADDIASGQSTFMVEMLETANILNNATDKSLLILDEVGRGTSTYDGLAIAHSILHDIHERIKGRTIFATHYHELNEIVNEMNRCECYHLEIIERGERIFFTHKVKLGYVDRSYGIHVAALAGIPHQVIEMAKLKLDMLLAVKKQVKIISKSY
ncbi:DNA mismatch repair protein MutS [Lyticum sinuosum]